MNQRSDTEVSTTLRCGMRATAVSPSMPAWMAMVRPAEAGLTAEAVWPRPIISYFRPPIADLDR